MKQPPIKVGVIAEQTGPLSFMGIANANVANMVIDDINAAGGLLGRQIDLYVEDGATIDGVAEAKATKLVLHDKVDVIFGGIYSSTRQAIKGPAVVKGRTLYIYLSNMRVRNAIRRFSAPGRCRRSRLILSFRG
jgi:branched-chain amino acid transport system substrate-binding protein